MKARDIHLLGAGFQGAAFFSSLISGNITLAFVSGFFLILAIFFLWKQ